MAIFDWMANLAIDAAGGGKAVFGSKPDVAAFTPTDLGAESKRAAEANTQNLPEIQALLEKILPGWDAMTKQGSKNTLALLRGDVPRDVQDRLRRNSAYKSFMGGYGGSGMAKALTARDFGLTSLDMMERGTNSAQRWSGMTREAVAPWMVTGPAQAQQTERNNLYRQATEQFSMNVAAAPDPAAAGLFNTIATIGGTAASFGMGAIAGAGGARPPATAATAGGAVGGYGAGPSAPNLTASTYAGWGAPEYSPYGPYRDAYQWGG